MNLHSSQVFESTANLGPEVPVLFHIVCSDNPLPPITIRRETSTGRPPQPPIVLLTGPKIEVQTPVIQDERKDKSIPIAVFDCRHATNSPPFIPPAPWKDAGFYRLDTLEGMRCLEQLLATHSMMTGSWGSPLPYGPPPPMFSHPQMIMGPRIPQLMPPMYGYPSHFVPVMPVPSASTNAALHRSNSTGSYAAAHNHRNDSRFLRRKPVDTSMHSTARQAAPAMSMPAKPTRTNSYEAPLKKEVRFSSDPPQEYRYPHDDDHDEEKFWPEGRQNGVMIGEPMGGYHETYPGQAPITARTTYEHTPPANRISDLLRRISTNSSSRRPQPQSDWVSPQRPRARLNHAEV